MEAMFQIVDRERRTVDLRLNPEQAHLDAHWARRLVVTKIRQHAGISSLVIARYVARCIAEENRTCVLVSHEAEATARLLARAKFIIDHPKPGVEKPKTSTDRANAIVFAQTGSSFWIGTAGQRTFGRGDTISDLHLSEAAFYQDPETLVDGLLPAAEKGEVIIESTGNGRGNWFHKTAQRAREGLGYELRFYSWVGVPSASHPLTEEQEHQFLASLSEDLEEPYLHYDQGVSLSQLAWRRERIQTDYSGDLARFKENYPRHFEECFRSAGLSFFPKVRYVETPRWIQESKHLWVLEGHPKPGHGYVMGVDVGAGIGSDNSTIEVFDLLDREQVAEWAGAHLAPDEFGREVAALGTRFNHAYVNVERNNHGLTTLSHLVSNYPLNRLHRGTAGGQPSQLILSHLNNYGTYVSETTRGLLLGTARRLLAAEYTLHSDYLNSELSTFVENKNGKYEASGGSLDDRVMAACHALLVVERAAIYVLEPVPVQHKPRPGFWSFESIIPHAEGPATTLYGISERFG